MKIAVMADDFTGANDIGIQLKKYSLKVAAMLEDIEADADVKVIDSDSRNRTKDEAVKRVREAYLELEKQGFDKFYKKIDSTLRGNLKEEIDEIIRLSGKKIALVPAFPKTKRVVRDGKHYVDGVELHKTDFANDPVKPIKTNNLLEMFPNGKVIKIDDIKNMNDLKLDKLEDNVLIFDSETDQDLELVAKFLVENSLDSYVAGSAGIMEYLPKYWGFEKRRVLMISGSVNIENINQLNEFVKVKNESLTVLKLDLKNFNYSVKGFGEDFLIQNISDKSDVLDVLDYHMKKGIEKEEINKMITEYIAKVSYEFIEKYNINTLFVAGGETAKNVLKTLGVKGLNLEYELETGVVKGKDFNNMYHIITKPGGFGSNKIYLRAYEILKTVDK